MPVTRDLQPDITVHGVEAVVLLEVGQELDKVSLHGGEQLGHHLANFFGNLVRRMV